MLISDWMARQLLTVDENTSLLVATRIMKDNAIRRLPVVANGKLVGIITDRDVKDASPAKTTGLDVHELHYLLSEMKIKEIMTANPIVLHGHESLEKAAVIMLQCRISGIPVVDEHGFLIGLLSETDVLRGFIHSTGIKHGAVQFVLDLTDEPGAVTGVVRLLREHKGRIISVLTSFEDAPAGMKRVAIRVLPEHGADSDTLSAALDRQYRIVYHAKDELLDIPSR
ncbi:MAG: CBS and ACT domain-containing protein [Thermodesulfobacteriota bacterium]